jgi:RNA polymerase sigma factor for flagellar operon FliA
MNADDRASRMDAPRPGSVEALPKPELHPVFRPGGAGDAMCPIRIAAAENDGMEGAYFRSAFDLVELNVRQTVRRLRTGVITLDDLRSLAQEGLLWASRTFDESFGIPFRRWANRRIRDALAEGLRQWVRGPRARASRRTRSTPVGDPLGSDAASMPPVGSPEPADVCVSRCMTMAAHEGASERLATEAAQNAEQRLFYKERLVRVLEAVARLPDPERALIERHDFGEATLAQAAASLGMSKSWASRLRSRAIAKLSRELRAAELV